jgi:D-lactate dehydrogenase
METTPAADKIALRLARNWSAVETLARVGLSATHAFSALFGVKPLTALTGMVRAVASPDLIPSVPGPMPRAARALPSTQKSGAAAVYFPACINRMFGRDPDSPASPSLPEVFVTLSNRAGKPLWIPPDVVGLCCSTPWKSKGYPKGHEFMAKSLAEAMLRWSDDGKIPIVVDAASCTLALSQDIASLLDPETKARYESLTVIDSIAWCRDLLPKLTIGRKLGRIAVHPSCSITHLELAKTLKQIATHLADDVEVPIGTTCCGTAGDRGLLHPELVVSATREVKAILDAHPAEAYISANRTCEMGLRHATGRPYESFVFLLEELSRPEAG